MKRLGSFGTDNQLLIHNEGGRQGSGNCATETASYHGASGLLVMTVLKVRGDRVLSFESWCVAIGI